MQAITRDELCSMMERGDDFSLVEVLPPESYELFHLPGAINVPLGSSFEENVKSALPDKDRPVVVYCSDEGCEASPAAAKRLDALGYKHVLGYRAGKEDWRRAGLHVERGSPHHHDHPPAASSVR